MALNLVQAQTGLAGHSVQPETGIIETIIDATASHKTKSQSTNLNIKMLCFVHGGQVNWTNINIFGKHKTHFWFPFRDRRGPRPSRAAQAGICEKLKWLSQKTKSIFSVVWHPAPGHPGCLGMPRDALGSLRLPAGQQFSKVQKLLPIDLSTMARHTGGCTPQFPNLETNASWHKRNSVVYKWGLQQQAVL